MRNSAIAESVIMEFYCDNILPYVISTIRNEGTITKFSSLPTFVGVDATFQSLEYKYTFMPRTNISNIRILRRS